MWVGQQGFNAHSALRRVQEPPDGVLPFVGFDLQADIATGRRLDRIDGEDQVVLDLAPTGEQRVPLRLPEYAANLHAIWITSGVGARMDRDDDWSGLVQEDPWHGRQDEQRRGTPAKPAGAEAGDGQSGDGRPDHEERQLIANSPDRDTVPDNDREQGIATQNHGRVQEDGGRDPR